jgi:hypothetical protein
MASSIVPYEDELVGQVVEFNARLRRQGVMYQFPESSESERLPRRAGREVYEEGYLFMENGTVRGGYLLKQQPFWINGQPHQVGCMRLPLSEGIIDRSYLTVGARLFVDAQRRQPLLYGLGIGGLQEPAVRLMLALGWTVRQVPFYFRVLNAQRVLCGLTYLRTSAVRARILDLVALSGLGHTCINLAQTMSGRRRNGGDSVAAEPADDGREWSQPIWERCRGEYTMIGARDRATLDVLYPRGSRFILLKVFLDGEFEGWSVLLATQMSGHRQFGNLRVGSVVDCLSTPDKAEAVIRAATSYLERAGVDLIVSNQSASPWVRALRRCGYLRGPSNFVFGASKDLALLLEPIPESFGRVHMTRGDGEGPANL